jgi:hypothetical protein
MARLASKLRYANVRYVSTVVHLVVVDAVILFL